MHVEFIRTKKSFWFFCAYRIKRYMWGIPDWNTGIHLVRLGHSTDLRVHLFGFGISIGKEWTKETK